MRLGIVGGAAGLSGSVIVPFQPVGLKVSRRVWRRTPRADDDTPGRTRAQC